MRAALILILLFLTYSLMYLPSTPGQKKASKKDDGKTYKVKTITGRKIKGKKSKKIQVYNVKTVKKSVSHNFEQFHFNYTTYLKRYRKILIPGSILCFILTMIISILLHKYNVPIFASFINNFGFTMGRFFVTLVSLMAAGTWLFLRHNLWQDIGFTAFILPFGTLICSCISLRVRDFNYPIWNRLIGSFVVPIISGLIIALRI